jgi:hypothetical protein
MEESMTREELEEERRKDEGKRPKVRPLEFVD